ncbi:class I SAM-dependent methyltransferase [Salipaludibacillus aurantiacus]|uniref:Putative SAM-dependent methyltransferase n=1 Tax=Salipaludibacillus aurantiacus TaxID=1601833 RepID=A0A1H9QEL9_9BACI|nr:class I SAM-dependent methyltransferase [Salipaludibacillus aurantiacus]SER58991.1 Putative SAM-dependent methyltransferase [Salipaludibacillus aurantiacus]
MIEYGIVTTPGRPSSHAVLKAQQLAGKWGLPFARRNKRSLKRMIEDYGAPVFIVSRERIEVHKGAGCPPFFFHPNGAMFRAKQFYRYGKDPLVDACRLQPGDTVVDATLGLASDAQLASLAVGEKGKVTGLESSPVIAAIVKEGLLSYQSSFQPLNEAMKRIKAVNARHGEWLRNQPDNSADVIYFDPMFEETVKQSNGFQPVRSFASKETLTGSVIEEAMRVARKRIVLKDHFRSRRFEEFGFKVHIRPSASYHFGVIETEKSEMK